MIKSPLVHHFSTESHFTWQGDVKDFSK